MSSSCDSSDVSASESDFSPVKKPVKKATKPSKKPAAKKAPGRIVSDESDDAYADENTSSNTAAASKPTAAGKKKTVEEIYQKKTQLEHILLRPDTYIGSVESLKQPMWVWQSTSDADATEGQMVYREIAFVPGFYKIFDEILVNAADNKIRDPTMDTIKVTIDTDNNTISVYNNGKGIPVLVHQKEKIYVPELIFGHLLTSSNYDDGEKKVTGGRNGYGAKLCNIFSKEFIVETADSVSKQKFKQVFKNNMGEKGEPKITSNSRGEEYTKITFKPDLAKFGMAEIDADTAALLKKRVIDLAGCVRNVKVYLNDTRVKIKNFRQYVDLYIASKDNNAVVLGGQKPVVVYENVSDRWEIAFTLSEGQMQQVSFVNSISTSKGGTHVNYIADQIASKLAEAIQKKNKAAPVKPFQIKNQMWLFVNCLVENPSFDSQTKENMTLKASAFGSKCSLSDDFLNKVKKSGIVENVLHWAKSKQDLMLKKTDGSKRSRITGITKLDDANHAGTKNAQNCTLILTEGDSAKTLAVTGLGVVGRDQFGVFPLRGKLLNVREASHKSILENQEINHVKQIMGLQHGKKYTDTSTLRYGHLMIMTDQDHDGSHIKGLIINFLDHFWPELLRVPGFLCEFITPIVKVSKGKTEIPFYTIPEYETWKEENNEGRGWTIKYYKGLGTSTKEDAKKYFSAIDIHRKSFSAVDDSERDLIDMAFNKKKTDNRKEWLRNFQPGTFMDHGVEEISITDFINRELILFSMADNIRSLPSVVDGLKPGLRKILFACFKRNLVKGEIKVAQLSGYVAEHSAYHHGEQSLQSSIVGMAQNFVGSNNVNLLEPRGQFGSRLQGGKDAASARYIFTRLSPLARKIFPKADDALLAYMTDDGQSIEPEWYMPILPLVLVNGGEGIGTGWSSFVPNYNPKEIVDNLKRMMRGEECERMHPWYRGFKGVIEPAGADKYNVSGIITKTSDTTLEITELPLRSWTQTYKEFLETLLNGTEKTPAFIKDYKEYHTDSSVHFVITLTEANMAKAEAEGLEKKFKIATSLSTSNMVCFDDQGRIRKYANVEQILEDFYHLRLTYYQKRKEYMADQLTEEWERLNNKVRFIMEIIQGKLVVQNKKKADVLTELRKREYKPFFKKPQKSGVTELGDGESEDEERGGADHGFDYLLSMALWSLTAERVEHLRQERDVKQRELDELLGTTPKQLWERDLDAFLEEWEAFVDEMEKAERASASTAGGKKGGKKKVVAKKKKTWNTDESSESEEDDDDDFRPKAKMNKAPSKTTLPVTKVSTVAPSKLASTKPSSTLATAMEKSKPFSSVISSSKMNDEESIKAAASRPTSAAISSKRKDAKSDSDDDALFRGQKQSPKKVKAAPKAKPRAGVIDLVSDSDSDDYFKSKPIGGAATKTSVKKIADMSDDDEYDLPVKKPSPPKPKKAPVKTAAKPKPAPKKKEAVISSDESEVSESASESGIDNEPVAPRRPIARNARQAAKKIEYVEVDSDASPSLSEEESEESYGDDSFEDDD